MLKKKSAKKGKKKSKKEDEYNFHGSAPSGGGTTLMKMLDRQRREAKEQSEMSVFKNDPEFNPDRLMLEQMLYNRSGADMRRAGSMMLSNFGKTRN